MPGSDLRWINRYSDSSVRGFPQVSWAMPSILLADTSLDVLDVTQQINCYIKLYITLYYIIPTPPSADVKETVKLYLYSSAGNSWSVLG